MQAGTQNKKQPNVDAPSAKQKRDNFDSYYNKMMSLQEQLKRINIVSDVLKKKYEEYDETSDFVNFLHAIEEVFAYAQKEKWSVEKTQNEMIESEIYIISRTTGIDEDVFRVIHNEFAQATNDIEKIQSIANTLMQKYDGDEECPVCKDFIAYIRDSLLVFSQTISGNTDFDEISEAKEKIIQLRMERMSVDGEPPMEVLQRIYDDFVVELHKSE